MDAENLHAQFSDWGNAHDAKTTSNLENRIRFLRHKRLLTDVLCDKADNIRRTGNDAVHQHTALVSRNASASGIIKDLSAIMKHVSR